MSYAVSINYGTGAVDLTAYVRQESFSRTETLYNSDRKAVVNTARFSIDMNTTLANALLTLSSSQEITCSITKDAAAWFTGYIRPVTDFTVSTGAEQIDFEAVDRLYFLQRRLSSTLSKVLADSMVVSDSGGGATSLVHALTSAITFPGTVYAPDISDTIDYFREESGETGRTVFDILNDLLFSYHQVFYADAAGDLRFHDWSPAAITPAGTFNGANIIESLTVSRDDKDEAGVAVSYYTTTTVANKRVVSGTEYGDIFLPSADSPYPPEYTDDYSEKYWHWGFDETEDMKCIGASYVSSRYFVKTVLSVFKKNLWVDADSDYVYSAFAEFIVTANTHSAATASSTFYGLGFGLTLSAYEVYADVTYKKKQGAVYYPATTTAKIKKFDAPLIYTKTAADELASALYDMITKGCFKYRFRSAVAAGIGTYYTIADTTLNISTTGRITKRTTTQVLGTEYYEYEAEGAAEISTLTTETQLATLPAPVNEVRVDVPIDGGIVTEKVAVEDTEVTVSGAEEDDNQRTLISEDGVYLQTYDTGDWVTQAHLIQTSAALAASDILLAFEDNVLDTSGNAVDGTAYGTPTYVTGQVGKAISLNGTDQYVTMPNVANRLYCGAGLDWTVGFWFYPNAMGAIEHSIISKNIGDGSASIFDISMRPSGGFPNPYNGHLYTSVRGTDDTVLWFFGYHSWVHVALTWNGTNLGLYKNATFVKNLAFGTGADSAARDIFIGAREETALTISNFLNGYLDEFRIVPTSTLAGVLEMYNNGAPAGTELSVDTIVGAPQIFYVEEQQNANTAGGTFTAGAWRTRVLNTEVLNTIPGASLASNQVTLPAGTYWIEAAGPAAYVNGHRTKIYDITNSADLLVGRSHLCMVSGGNSDTILNDYARVEGKIVLTASTVMELQHWCITTRATNGLGYPTNIDSLKEKYSYFKATRLA